MHGGEINVQFEVIDKGLKKDGVEKALLMPINDISWQSVKEMNDYLVKIVENNPEYEGFIDLDLSKAHLYGGLKDLENTIIYYYQKGLKGIKIHLQNLGVCADDWRLLPVYRIAGELNIPITMHCYPGSPPGLSHHSDPGAIEKMVRVFHKTTFLLAHFGGVKHFYDMPNLNHENVYFETSGIMPVLIDYFDKKTITKVFREIGYDKIIFGSDYPAADLDETIKILQDIVPPDQLENVMHKNILKLAEQFGWWK